MAATIVEFFDSFSVADKESGFKTGDFVIGNADYDDAAYDWFYPLDMKIDYNSSSIPVMPQAESTYIEMPSVDGSMIENTTYKNRTFTIVAYSQIGLTRTEKEELKRKITKALDETKNQTKKLTFSKIGLSFDVKYSGSASIIDGASYVKASIPLESNPYGYRSAEKTVSGSGLIVNEGDKAVGCVHKIASGATNPSFRLGDTTYTWTGTVPDGNTLTIDHDDYSCYLTDSSGNKTNAIDKLNGEFKKVESHESILISCDSSTEKYMLTSIPEKFLWNYIEKFA
jgi:phage-related protein